MEIVDEIKRGLADAGAKESLDVPIARSYRSAQARQGGIGLDRDPLPTFEIERERRVVVNRVPGSDIDIEPLAAPAEAAQQVQVLEALGVAAGRLSHASHPQWGDTSRCTGGATRPALIHLVETMQRAHGELGIIGVDQQRKLDFRGGDDADVNAFL